MREREGESEREREGEREGESERERGRERGRDGVRGRGREGERERERERDHKYHDRVPCQTAHGNHHPSERQENVIIKPPGEIDNYELFSVSSLNRNSSLSSYLLSTICICMSFFIGNKHHT